MAEHQVASEERASRGRVLLVDDDQDMVELVTAILTDEGYEVTAIAEPDHASIAKAVGRVEPDCILLDSSDGPEFGTSWDEAAYLSTRRRAVPTVSFTAGTDAVREAREGASDRATAARFAAIVSKPFRLDDLLDAVATAVGQSEPFDRSTVGDQQRTAALVTELERRGATDIETSRRREWATFVAPHDEHINQIYWWQLLGHYVVGRYDDDAHLAITGHYFERTSAVDAAFQSGPATVSA